MKQRLLFSICISVLAVLLISGLAAAAAPSFFGYSGLIRVPTADSLDKGEYSAGAFAIDLEEGVDSNVYAGNVGVAGLTEIGFARLKPEGADAETSINAKHEFMVEDATHPSMAVGVIDVTGETDATAYFVLSKSIRRGSGDTYGDVTSPRIHVGAGGGQLDGFFGGISASLGNRLLLMAEYDSSDINFGARLAITNEIRVHGALLDGDDVALGASFTKSF